MDVPKSMSLVESFSDCSDMIASGNTIMIVILKFSMNNCTIVIFADKIA